MSGNHESGIATESSTAAPNDIESSPAAPIPLPFPKIKKHITIVRMNSAAIAIVLSLPRFEMPTRIQSTINAPITIQAIHLPVSPIFRILFTESEPS